MYLSIQSTFGDDSVILTRVKQLFYVYYSLWLKPRPRPHEYIFIEYASVFTENGTVDSRPHDRFQ